MKSLFFSLIFIAIIGCGKKEQSKKSIEVVRNVKVEILEKKDITKSNNSSGVVEVENEVSEITPTGGTVKKINFKNGDRVKAGEVLVVLENVSVQSAYAKAKASYISSKSDYETKKINFRKIQQLRLEKLISEDEFLTNKNQFTNSESMMYSAEANFISAKDDYEKLIMKAKISGIVTDLDVKIYEKINNEKVVFVIVDDSKMYVKTSVSPMEILGIEVGNIAEIEVEGTTKIYNGKVSEINPVAGKESKKYPVKIIVENSANELKKGMYANISLESGTRNTFVVNKSSIVLRDLFSYIYVNEKGVAREIRVERGYSKGNELEIISEELTPGMEIVVDGQYILENKDKLKVVK
ncbi:MAG: efflux RND transporter periplasmic adaptor subunit [Fusobacteriaceae bacterium]